MKLLDAFVETGLCKSKKEAKRLIASGGARVNDQVVTQMDLEIVQCGRRLFVGKWEGDKFIVEHY